MHRSLSTIHTRTLEHTERLNVQTTAVCMQNILWSIHAFSINANSQRLANNHTEVKHIHDQFEHIAIT